MKQRFCCANTLSKRSFLPARAQVLTPEPRLLCYFTEFIFTYFFIWQLAFFVDICIWCVSIGMKKGLGSRIDILKVQHVFRCCFNWLLTLQIWEQGFGYWIIRPTMVFFRRHRCFNLQNARCSRAPRKQYRICRFLGALPRSRRF